MKLKVIIRAGEPPHQRCRAEVPVLPGCVSEGDTAEEALANIRTAIASYFDASEPPRGDRGRVEEIELNVRADNCLDAAEGDAVDSVFTGPALSTVRRFFLEHGRHESATVVSLTVGLFAALSCGALAWAPMWIGFLIAYLSTAGFAALVHTMEP